MIRIPPTLLWPAAGLAILWCPLHAANEAAAAPRIAGDGRSMDVCVAGLGTIPCRWAATIEKAGTVTCLDSGTSGQGLQPAVHGSIADGITVVIASPETAAELLFRVRLEGGTAVCARAGVRNTGRESFMLIDTTPVQARIPIEKPDGWLLTGLHPRTPVLAPLPGIGGQVGIHEYGTFYQPNGTGLVFGPVGEPVSYAEFSWSCEEPGVFGLDAVTPMDGVRVDPGETRWGQEVALVSGPRLTFRCLKSTKRGGAVLKVQSSSDLGLANPWTSNEAAVPDADATVNGVIFDITDDGDFIHVIADIPAPGGAKLFVRLSAVNAP